MALDPSHNHTFEVLEQLLGELGAIFTDTTFHLGGDEVIIIIKTARKRLQPREGTDELQQGACA